MCAKFPHVVYVLGPIKMSDWSARVVKQIVLGITCTVDQFNLAHIYADRQHHLWLLGIEVAGDCFNADHLRLAILRSEERRVGKEWRSGVGPWPCRQNN